MYITLNGFNFTSTNSCSASFRDKTSNQLTSVPAVTCSATAANISIPKNLSTGVYYISVSNPTGESNPLQETIFWMIGSLVWQSGSLAGSYSQMSGGVNYPPKLSDTHTISITASPITVQDPQVLSCCSNNIATFYFPPVTTNTTYTIAISDSSSTSIFYYYAKTIFTPALSILSPSNLTLISNTATTFTINSTGPVNPVITNLSLVSTINNNDVTILTFTKIDSTRYSFSVTLPAGSYKIVANSTYGLFSNSNTINVLAPTLTASTLNTSFAGGNFTITANKLSPSSYITLNGQRGNIIKYTSTQVTYQIPILLTPSSQAQFNFAQDALIDSSSFSYISDSTTNSTSSKSFDGNTLTSYTSTNTLCFIGVDTGPSQQASVSRLRFFPSITWKNAQKLQLA